MNAYSIFSLRKNSCTAVWGVLFELATMGPGVKVDPAVTRVTADEELVPA